MKKFLKILGITMGSLLGLLVILAIIGAIVGNDETSETDNKVEKKEIVNDMEKMKKSDLDKVMAKIEKTDNPDDFNKYFSRVIEISKGGYIDSGKADSIVNNREFFEFNMEQRALKKWVKKAKKEFPKQFNKLDGSNEYLVEAVKEAMNDPLSFRHEITKWEYGSGYKYVRVYMQYSGKNAFNARVKNTVTAIIDIEGNILEVE